MRFKHGLIKVKYSDGLYGVKKYKYGVFIGYLSGDGRYCFFREEYKLKHRFPEETADLLIDNGVEI